MLIAVDCTAVLVGALVRGYTGFGASMIWVASLSPTYPPASVVPPSSLSKCSQRHFAATGGALGPAEVDAVDDPGHRRDHAARHRSPLDAAGRKMRIAGAVAVAVLATTLAVACGVSVTFCPAPAAALTAGLHLLGGGSPWCARCHASWPAP